jgi:hypothetical protein
MSTKAGTPWGAVYHARFEGRSNRGVDRCHHDGVLTEKFFVG